MSQPDRAASQSYIASPADLLLITGATGFIGPAVVKALLERGFRRLRCLVRPTSRRGKLDELRRLHPDAEIEILEGNLLSPPDCRRAVENAAVVFHLAAARGEKSFPDAFMNSVVTTRNLLSACAVNGAIRRFVNVSSFAVYSNRQLGMLDESAPVEEHPECRKDAYCFAKVKQEEIVAEYARRFAIDCVTLRPGHVYGPGNQAITGRVGISTFGRFLHLGGANPVPFAYVDNCAAAIALAGITAGVAGEVFNVVDDDLPTSREFLRLYKRRVKRFPSLYVPHAASYLLCWLWEKYAQWSQEQVPPVFNRARWRAVWKKTAYSNHKLKMRLGWQPPVPTAEALERYFLACRLEGRADA